MFHSRELELVGAFCFIISSKYQIERKKVSKRNWKVSEMQESFYVKDYNRLGDQIINVREQQDALEFFNAFVDVIDEGAKKLGEAPICEKFFGGAFSDQKICKDCPHRSFIVSNLLDPDGVRTPAWDS